MPNLDNVEEFVVNINNVGDVHQGIISFNGTPNQSVVVFDTANRTITFRNSTFLIYGKDRYSLANKTCTWSASGSANNICYYSISNGSISAVGYNNYIINDNNIFLFSFTRNNWGVDANSLTVNYTVDNIDYIVKQSKTIETAFVAENGSNSASGDSTHPFATVEYALSLGCKNICVSAGNYKLSSSLNIANKDGINIFANNNDTYSSSSPVPRARPVFYCGDDYSTFTDEGGGIVKTFTPTSVPERYEQVFIDHTLDPFTTGTRPSANACLWVHYADKTKDFRADPVLTTSDLTATGNSFYYNGTKVYIHATDNTFTHVTVGFDINVLLNIVTSSNIKISGLSFKYAGSTNARINKSNNIYFENCTFEYCSFGNNVSSDYSDTFFKNCESFKARNDGFNCHYYGISTYINCHSHYNGDDGESSHEYCKVIVNGGEYNHNGKGGHAPVNGCEFYDNGSYSHHNAFGYYCIAQGISGVTFETKPILIMNSIAINNTTDIMANSIDVLVGNTKYVTHSEASGGSITDL